LARLLTEEEGKPYVENEEEIFWTYDTHHYYAELGRHERGRFLPPGDPDQINFVIKEPYGVVACITPWNYPLLLLAWKLAPALAAGNTVVIKPSEYTPLSTLRLIEIAFDHLPPGVVNVITGYGPEVGEPLVVHPNVPLIAFTSSVETGQRIASLAAPMMKKVRLELGGKDPFVLAPDIVETVGLDTAVSAVAYAGLINAGQVCTSSERIYVHESHFGRFSTVGEAKETFTPALAEAAADRVVGHGLEGGVQMGPVISPNSRERISGLIEMGTQEGASLLLDGRSPDLPGLEKGAFLRPTILENVHPDSELAGTEIFGPVMGLMHAESLDEALAWVNSGRYGNMACIFTSDGGAARRFRYEAQAGNIGINIGVAAPMAFFPFSGWKDSFFGTLHAQSGHSVEFYTQTKVVVERWLEDWSRQF